MLGASTVAHTSRDSPSVTALPPDEGVELADVDSLRDGRVHSLQRPFGLMILVPYTRFLHTHRMRDPFG